MVDAFSVRLAASKIRKIFVCCFVLLLCGCVWRYFSGSLHLVLQTAVLLAAAWAWREPPDRICRIEIRANQEAWLVFADDAVPAQLLSGSLIAPLMMGLKWRCDGKIIRHTLLPDMTDAASWRRLTVWARFCRSAAEKR